MDLTLVLYFAGALAAVCFLFWLFARPIKFILKLVLNAVLGAVVLMLINLIGSDFGVTIAVNPFTAVVTGVLGIPGVILLFILKLIFP